MQKRRNIMKKDCYRRLYELERRKNKSFKYLLSNINLQAQMGWTPTTQPFNIYHLQSPHIIIWVYSHNIIFLVLFSFWFMSIWGEQSFFSSIIFLNLADVRASQTFTLFAGFSDVCCTNITESPCLHNYSNLHHSFLFLFNLSLFLPISIWLFVRPWGM